MNNEEKILQILSEIKGDIAEMKSDIAELKNAVVKLEDDMVHVKSDIAELKNAVIKLEDDMVHVKSDLYDLKASRERMETTLNSTRETVIRMENEQGQQLRALFDGYSNLYDVMGEIRVDIGVLKHDRDKHVMYIKYFAADRRFAKTI